MKKKLLIVLGLCTLTLGLAACSAKKDPVVEQGNNTVVEDTQPDTNAEQVVEPEENTTNNTENDNQDDANEVDNSTSTDIQQDSEAVKIFDQIWDLFEKDEKFPGIGGSMASPVDGKPGAFDLLDKDGLAGSFYVPKDFVDSVDDAATMMHMMNANTFTGAVVHVSDAKSFADAVKEKITKTQWICGFPDRMVVADVGDGYVAYGFGEASIMESFYNRIKAAFPDADVVYDVEMSSGSGN